MKNIFYFILLLIGISSCKTIVEKEKTTGLITNKAMVVSAREEASKIGASILKQGGNAFDAMVATELALAVAYPYAGNIGGGGFMIYRKNNGEIGALDYREKAPLASSKDILPSALVSILSNLLKSFPSLIGLASVLSIKPSPLVSILVNFWTNLSSSPLLALATLVNENKATKAAVVSTIFFIMFNLILIGFAL